MSQFSSNSTPSSPFRPERVRSPRLSANRRPSRNEIPPYPNTPAVSDSSEHRASDYFVASSTQKRPPSSQSVVTSSLLPSNGNNDESPRTQFSIEKCEACERVESSECKIWRCVYCNDSSICDDCWGRQIAHKPGKTSNEGNFHEKTDIAVLNRLQGTLNPSTTKEERHIQHRQDENTTWFGISRDETGWPILCDFGRFSTILSGARAYDAGHRYPQLISFIGQTGAGKSTLVKMLIEQQESEHRDLRAADKQFPSPIVGHVSNEHTPTSGDVHLYADPTTYFGSCPLLYADCEGLEGGERTPAGAMHRETDKKESRDKSWHDHKNFSDRSSEGYVRRRSESKSGTEPSAKKIIRKSKRNDGRRLEWATDPEKKKRGYAVTELYPRLLYTFSDTVVFVIRNARAFEATLLERIIDWAHASLEKSINQPALPHAIIVQNATDLRVDQKQWNSDIATQTLMNVVSRAVNQVPKFNDLASFWRQRGYDIYTTEDLLLRYYASVRVVRVPAQGRYMLLNEQIGQLHAEIIACCNKSYVTKRRARMLSTTDELNTYLQAAFDHFSSNLDEPFNFVEVSLKANPIPFDFGGNILSLVRAVHQVYPDTSGPWLFKSTSSLVASCIMLDCVRRNLKGYLERLLEDEYLDFCELALYDFCELFWPCSYTYKDERCVVKRNVHENKGHQSARGKIIGSGPFRSDFNYEGFVDEWLDLIRAEVRKLQSLIDDKLAIDRKLTEKRIVTDNHLQRVTEFYGMYGGATKYFINTVCLCCFRETPKHPLPCGHVLCSSCIGAYAAEIQQTFISMRHCPLHVRDGPWNIPWNVPTKPPLAGVRILCLDGGGIRGVVELEVLRAIEIALGRYLSINLFFDLITGTSTGGIIALGIGAERWSVDQCLTNFLRLCDKAFSAHKTGPLALLRHGGRYRTTALTEALQDVFSKHLLFGGEHASNAYANKVAVTSTTESWEHAVVFANYNRDDEEEELMYRFERPESPNDELRVWEAARATSAAPTYFKPFVNTRTHQGYLDGALYHNNPVDVANDERKLLWPEDASLHPDVLLSIGTGHHGEASKPLESTTPKRHKFRRARLSKDPDDFPNPEDRVKGPKSWSVIPRLETWIRGMHNRFDNVLDAEETWHRFRKQAVPDQYSFDRRRYQRLNPSLGFKVPKLDDKEKVFEIQRVVRNQMDQDLRSNRSEIKGVARRLIASSFYIDVRRIHKDEDNYKATAVIRCRFSDDTDEIRNLGRWLMSRQNTRFQPHFLYEVEQEARLRRETISQDMIQNMIAMATFTGPRVEMVIYKPSVPSIINVCLDEHGDHLPISGFPRVLVNQNELQIVRSHDTGESRDSNPRLNRARRRRSARAMRSMDLNDLSANASPRQNTSPRATPRATPNLGRVAEDERSIRSAPELTISSSTSHSASYPPSISKVSGAPPPQPSRSLSGVERRELGATEHEDPDMVLALEMSMHEVNLRRSPTDELEDFQNAMKLSMIEK